MNAQKNKLRSKLIFTRYPVRIISLALALLALVLIAALPILAQKPGEGDSSAPEVENLKFFTEVTGNWVLAWDNNPELSVYEIWFKGGNITTVWTKVNNINMAKDSKTTYARFSPLSNAPSGLTFNFRVKGGYDCNAAGLSCSWTDWATVDKTFS